MLSRLCLPALLLTLIAVPARAADEPVPTIVLGLEALEGAPESVGSAITDALRQRVAATKGYQLLQGKDLVEVKLVFACPDEAPGCMSQAGKTLGADKLIFGNVKRAGSDYQVTLKLLDVSRAVVESFTAETVPRKHADASGLRSLAPAWLAKLSGKGGGSIQVRANFPGAAVSLAFAGLGGGSAARRGQQDQRGRRQGAACRQRGTFSHTYGFLGGAGRHAGIGGPGVEIRSGCPGHKLPARPVPAFSVPRE
jgi:hypothetical protein